MLHKFVLFLALVLSTPALYAANTSDSTKKFDIVVGVPGIYRVPISKGVSIQEAIESMKLRANALNIKLVAEQALSKQVEAMTGEAQRTMAIYQFCDALTAKELIDFNMEFAVFLPCRVAAIQDQNGQAWLMMMDLDISKLSIANKLPPELRKRITAVRDNLVAIIQAGANGDL